MQVSVETTTGLGRRITVGVPAERIDEEVRSRLKTLAGRVRLDGFRPGKVPMSVVERRFGHDVHQEVIGEMVQSSFYEAVTQEKLRPAGRPTIEPMQRERGEDLQYTATFEVYPTIQPAPLDQLRVEKPVSEVTDADVDQMLEVLRKQRTNWAPVQRAARDGDRVVVDFKGSIEGEDFPGNEGKQVPVTLGSNSFIPGFEAGLLGAGAGDERTLELQFPADYGAKAVAGRPVRFDVKVTSVAEPEVPPIDEAFAKQFGVADGSVAALRQQVRENMQRELQQTLRATVKNQVMDALLQHNPIEVPHGLVQDEVERLRRQTQQQFSPGQSAKQAQLPAEMFQGQAERRVKLGLLLAEIIEHGQIKVDADRLRAAVDGIAATYEQPEEVVKWYYSHKEHLSELESVVLEDQVVDWVLGQAQVVEKPVSFDDVMKPNKAA